MMSPGWKCTGAWLLAAAALACGRPRETAPSDTAVASSSSLGGFPSASASASSQPIDPSAALKVGRKLAQAGNWKEAARALAEATEANPDDPILLAELGWAELKAGDNAASKATSEHALEIVKEPRIKAQLLYNLGRVAEATGDKDTAKKRYEESLVLRANRTVQARLEDLGGKAPKKGSVSAAMVCDKQFPNVQALCDCLQQVRGLLANASGTKTTCTADKSAPKMESAELAFVRFGPERGSVGEALLLLAANVKGGLRPVAELGRDYVNDDKSTQNRVVAKSVDDELVGARHVLLVKTEETDTDGGDGPETYSARTLRATACVLRDETHETICPTTLPLEIDETLTGKAGFDRKARFELVLSDGKAALSLKSGDKSLAPPNALGGHALW